MGPIKKIVPFFLFLIASVAAATQDTLPKFSVLNLGNNRVVVGWVNAYQQVKQISIQRSFDSLLNYKTILSVADPNAVQNGFADTKAPNDHMFYRLFVMLDQGSFFFTPARRPVRDTAKTPVALAPKNTTALPAADSLKTVPAPVIKKPEYVPSVYVYTNSEGYVFVNLPDADQKKYHVKFYEENNSFLFELKNIRDAALTLDKANFYHGGWFYFELYNDDKLLEKNKFFLARDF